jgi:hypothetical protein
VYAGLIGKITSTTPKKKWPQTSEWARLDSIALAAQSCLILDTLIDDLDNTAQVRELAHVVAKLKDIQFKLTVCKEKNE